MDEKILTTLIGQDEDLDDETLPKDDEEEKEEDEEKEEIEADEEVE